MNGKLFKNILIVISFIFIIFLSCVGLYSYHISKSIQDMFRLNGKLQSEGYYMGEFEFKMMGIAYWLDRGQYGKALFKFEELHLRLVTRSGLIKIPRLKDKRAELQFYLSLQNPRTGAFMDDSFPLFTYIGPTLNMVEYLEGLAKETGQPFHLKYQLRFLDRIAGSQKLKIYLEDLSTVGYLGSRLPKTPYIAIAELCYYNDLERSKLYTFTPEWKNTLLKWLYKNQDSKTGFWGPRFRNNGNFSNFCDLGTTLHILKLFVDKTGQNRHSAFPLRYKNAMFITALRLLARPMPANSNLDEVHDWSLTRSQGLNLLTNFLWKDASVSNKMHTKKLMEQLVKNRYQKFYLPSQGAFSLYPGDRAATLDGTGTALGLLDKVGALSKNKQAQLWGIPDEKIKDLGIKEVSCFQENDFGLIKTLPGINSIRFYHYDPDLDNYESNVDAIFYPHKTPVLDTADLLPKLNLWIHRTSQHMGNWVNKDSIIQQLSDMKIQSVPVFREVLPVKYLNSMIEHHQKVFVIGFDTLQTPKYKIVYYHN